MTDPIPTPPYEPPALKELGTLAAMTRGSFGLLGDAFLQGPLLGDSGGNRIVGGSA